MTLQQLIYVIEVANSKSITQAARNLFISQPSLTNQIKDLEKEMNLKIFDRTNRGIIVSKEGEKFLSYARSIVEQTKILENEFMGTNNRLIKFSLSTQHYSFAVNAFIELIKKYNDDTYDFVIKETETYQILEDVENLKSEIGIIYLDNFNKDAILKVLREKNLEYKEIITCKPHAFISKNSLLAKKDVISLKDLENMPFLSFEQGNNNSMYFSEEIFSKISFKKNIKVRDRGSLFMLLIGLDGFTLSSGVIDDELNGKEIIAKPLKESNDMKIIYIYNKKVALSKYALEYLNLLIKYLNDKI